MLTREQTDEILSTLGFQFEDDGTLVDNPYMRNKFTALRNLIASAIAEAVVEPGSVVDDGLLEWVEEYLVG